MIGFLRGKILAISEKKILVETSGGVGYEIFPAGQLLSQCTENGDFAAEILTIVRENEISLYGFGARDEKILFQKLLAVSGIGPKVALTIVSTPIENFTNAVKNGEIDFLVKIPGLGKKTAERLVVELRGKLNFKIEQNSPQSKNFSEAVDALQNLGYEKNSIEEILNSAPKKIQNSTEKLVKFFLSSGE